MGGSGSTDHIKLTKVSDGSVSHSFLLAENADGGPAIRFGAVSDELQETGQIDVINFNSLHHGSGQAVENDKMMFDFANNMFADEPGLIRAGGELREREDYGTLNFSARARGGFRPGINDGNHVVIMPDAIRLGTVVQLNPDPPDIFTGKYAEFGRRIYFGSQRGSSLVSGNVGVYNAIADNWQIANDVTANAVGKDDIFATMLTVQGDRLWKCDDRSGADGSLFFSFTQDTGNDFPLFGTEFPVSYLGDSLADMSTIGPHIVFALGSVPNSRGKVLAINADGVFTPLIDEIGSPMYFIPYLGGLLLPLTGGMRSVWLRDVQDFSTIDMRGMDESRGFPIFPRIDPTDPNLLCRPAGAAFIADGTTVFFTGFGKFIQADGTQVDGTTLFMMKTYADGVFVQSILTPDQTELRDAYCMAMALVTFDPGSALEAGKRLYLLMATPTGTATCTVKLYDYAIWDGLEPPVNPVLGPSSLPKVLTSRLRGQYWTTKSFRAIRGSQTIAADVSIQVRLDGSDIVNETIKPGVGSGPWSNALASNTVARSISLEFSDLNAEAAVQLPVELETIAFPQKDDIVRLGILAGRNQPRPRGGVSNRRRDEQLDEISAMVTSPEEWTLKWEHAPGMPDWTVIPVDYQTVEEEDGFVPATGALLAWLTVRRVG